MLSALIASARDITLLHIPASRHILTYYFIFFVVINPKFSIDNNHKPTSYSSFYVVGIAKRHKGQVLVVFNQHSMQSL
ncbi:hypothetical protein FRX31_027162 [Thalictrum thalictroides]|uniref:Uncharacterized protein n=1 Tax=Thalictrum thalictroides TaxID=46969 RepID=A0A7J6VED1_THATH|nr:hypothetical protein FRX31_027162 [Thalictrum thalictroides]